MPPPTILAPEQWQPVPGADGWQVYPIEPRPSALNSNAYLFASAAGLVLVDAGASGENVAAIQHGLAQAGPDSGRTLHVILTHGHRDHLHNILQLPGVVSGRLRIFAHAMAVRALAARDANVTTYYMYGEPVPDMPPITPLFSAARGIAMETLPLGPGVRVQVHAAPGHSPDGVVVRIGALLVVGDLLLTAAPGVAGIPGWDRALACASLAHVAELVRREGLAVVCAGHGGAMPAAAALTLLDRTLDDTRRLPPLVQLDAQRAEYLCGYVSALRVEAHTLLATLGGRLQKVAEALDLLEAGEIAGRLRGALNLDDVDRALAGLKPADWKAGDGNMMVAVLKALHVVTKLRAMVHDARLDGLIEPSLWRRIQNLFADLTNVVYGLPVGQMQRPCDVGRLVADLQQYLARPFQDQALFVAGEGEDQFAHALAQRLALPAYFRQIRLSVRPPPVSLPQARIDGERVSDLLIGFLEQLHSHAGGAVSLGLEARNNVLALRLEPAQAAALQQLHPGRVEYARLVLRELGGDLRIDTAALELHLPT